jgi:uroporphyrinogen III methyltransferase/synthase
VDAVAGRLHPGARVLLARAAEAREVLPEELIRRGALVDVVSAYRTIKAASNADDVRGLFQEGKIHAVTFTSSSTVKHFLDLVGSDGGVLLRDVVVASIGPITAETAARQGIVSHVVPESYTIPALADALIRHFQATRPTSGPE